MKHKECNWKYSTTSEFNKSRVLQSTVWTHCDIFSEFTAEHCNGFPLALICLNTGSWFGIKKNNSN
jgi:hypothetical protein